jgi:hypothetical protein
MVAAAQPTPLPESDESIGYESVADALEALSSDPRVQWSKENGWPIATDEGRRSIWSFAPPSYPAYPAVVLRRVTPKGSGSAIEMSVLCEASKAACDDLVRTFSSMNGLPLPN